MVTHNLDLHSLWCMCSDSGKKPNYYGAATQTRHTENMQTSHRKAPGWIPAANRLGNSAKDNVFVSLFVVLTRGHNVLEPTRFFVVFVWHVASPQYLDTKDVPPVDHLLFFYIYIPFVISFNFELSFFQP